MITITSYLYTVIYSYVLQMGYMLSVQNKRLITLTVITLGGFHCTSVCYPDLPRTISQFNHLLNSPNKNAKKLTADAFRVFYFQCC